MSKNKRFNETFDQSEGATEIDEMERLPSDDEAGEAELNIKPEDNQFVPNSLVYNAYGISPTTATYAILISDLKEKFTRICKSQIDGVDDVIIKYDKNTGEVLAFCSFVENCHHFNDRSMEGTMMSDQRSEYFSPEVKAFAKKFGVIPEFDCRTSDGKISKNFASFANKRSMNAKMLFVRNYDSMNSPTNSYSMRLSWTTLVRLMFDANGNAFYKQYGKRGSKCTMSAHFEFEPANNEKFGRLKYLVVTKSLQGPANRSLSPKVAFNYSEA